MSQSELNAVKKAVNDAIDNRKEQLNQVSQALWKNPELAFEEHKAHALLCDFLEGEGFAVERGFHLETAFRAVYTAAGDGQGPHVCVLCEYDALPVIGHGCGHNLIAECGLAAGLGIRAGIEAMDKPAGKLTILGSPAEEGGGGKIKLLEEGAVKDVDIAMMAHPMARNICSPVVLSIVEFNIFYIGKAAHAAMGPWQGVNALDAAVIFYQSLSVLRQQMKPEWRAHCIIKKGGEKPNIIPDLTQVDVYLRAPTETELSILIEKAMACAEAAAKATGCQMQKEERTYHHYMNMNNNKLLAGIYKKNIEGLGYNFSGEWIEPMGSTDMGNVSHVVPSIHPMFDIGTTAVNHSTEFTQAAGAAKAQQPTLDQGRSMAMTAMEVLLKSGEGLLKQIKEEFVSNQAESTVQEKR